MTIIGFFGLPGSGKSLLMTQHAIEMAVKREKRLAFNFPINLDSLATYALANKYDWIIKLINDGGIFYINSFAHPDMILKIADCIVCMDEASILFPAKSHWQLSQSALADLCLLRHHNIDLCYAAQHHQNLNNSFFRLTDYVFHVSGVKRYSKELRNQELVIQQFIMFSTDSYEAYMSSASARSERGIFKSFSYFLKRKTRGLNLKYYWLFNLYDSFVRLDKFDTLQFNYRSGSMFRIELDNIPTYDDFIGGKKPVYDESSFDINAPRFMVSQGNYTTWPNTFGVKVYRFLYGFYPNSSKAHEKLKKIQPMLQKFDYSVKQIRREFKSAFSLKGG